jgi:hypothetical protein
MFTACVRVCVVNHWGENLDKRVSVGRGGLLSHIHTHSKQTNNGGYTAARESGKKELLLLLTGRGTGKQRQKQHTTQQPPKGWEQRNGRGTALAPIWEKITRTIQSEKTRAHALERAKTVSWTATDKLWNAMRRRLGHGARLCSSFMRPRAVIAAATGAMAVLRSQ